MTVAISVRSYPNNEVRATCYPVRTHLTLVKKLQPCSERASQPLPSGKKGYGTLGRQYAFSTYARRQLLRSGATLDEVVPASECLFLTGTLPGSTHESFSAIAAYSSWIVHTLKAWLCKFVGGSLSMYVWENQKRGALHLHYVVHVPGAAGRDYVLKNFKAEWTRLIDGVASRSGVDMWAKSKSYRHSDKDVLQTRAVVVEKSVGRYMAKYLSKNGKPIAKGFTKSYSPVRWYGIGRELLRRTREATQERVYVYHSHSAAAADYEDFVRLVEENCSSVYKYSDTSGNSRVVVGYVDVASNVSRSRIMQEVDLQKRFGVPHEWCVRLELLRVAVVLYSQYSALRSLILEVGGECVCEAFRLCQHSSALDVYAQINLLQTVDYAIALHLRRCDGLPSSWMEWRSVYRSARHLLSDGDGAIADPLPTFPEEKKSSGGLTKLNFAATVVQRGRKNALQGEQLSLWSI